MLIMFLEVRIIGKTFGQKNPLGRSQDFLTLGGGGKFFFYFLHLCSNIAIFCTLNVIVWYG